jgi:hypothetical protein
MNVNNKNPSPNYFPPGNNAGGAYNGARDWQASFAGRPQTGNIWNLPIQNFRLDAGANNIYNQRVSVDWPQFRPQSPIFSGPRVNQDQTDIYARPGANYNFDDNAYSNIRGGINGGGLPGLPNPFPNKPYNDYIGGWPDMYYGKPNHNFWPNPWDNCWPKPGPKPDPKPVFVGKGSIDGASFRSGDGERYKLNLENGKSYNLLSDVGVGLNGTYGLLDGEQGLTDVAVNVGGKIVNLSSDGIFLVDGKRFDKKKNSLDGNVTEVRKDTYKIVANGYEFELKASPSGVDVKIDAKRGRTPEGLWGVSLDGEKNTESELQKAIKESDYKITDVLTFDYEDNNNIGDGSIPDLEDEERNDIIWNSRDPNQGPGGFALWLNQAADGAVRDFGIWGGKGFREDDAYWTMNALQANRYYNVFSDEEIQVNGKFLNGKPTELGLNVNGDNVRVERTPGQPIRVSVNGSVVTSYNNNGITLANGVLNIKADGDEGWAFNVRSEGHEYLGMNIQGQAGGNNTRSSGLLGDSIVENVRDNGSDLNGAGYLRNADGSLSKAGANMTAALREYLVDNWDDTENGRSVFDR